MSDKIPWEAGKEYTLQNGWRCRIYATDGSGNQSIHGAYWLKSPKGWIPAFWNCKGTNIELGKLPGSGFDLVPPAPPRIKGECWLVVEDDYGDCATFTNKREALKYAAVYSNKAIIHVSYDVAEGEGLEP